MNEPRLKATIYPGPAQSPMLSSALLFRQYLFALLLLCGAHFAWAQQSPYQFPTGAASWTISCQKKEASTKPSANIPPIENGEANTSAPASGSVIPAKIEVARSAALEQCVIHYSNGRRQELWSVPDLGVILTEDPNGQAFVTREVNANGNPFSSSYFSWIQPGTRAGDKPEQFDGVDCLHYKGFIVVPDMMGTGKPETVPCEAWIDIKTLQPVALLKGDILGRFTFGATPGDLAIPKKFQDRLTYYKVTMGIQDKR